MKLEKGQLEYYVAKIYQVKMGLDDYELIKFESPDFILWKKHKEKIGIEIVQPSLEKQNLLIKMGNGDFVKQAEKKELQLIEENRIIKRDNTIYRILSSESKEERIDSIRSVLFKEIDKKTSKLNNKYTIFDKNVLCCSYVYPNFYEIDCDILISLLNDLLEKYKRTYDIVWVMRSCEVFTFCKGKNGYSYNYITIPSETSTKIQMVCSQITNE